MTRVLCKVDDKNVREKYVTYSVKKGDNLNVKGM